MSAIRFRPRLLPTLAALLVAGIGIALGNWQRGRAAEKQALQESFEQRAREGPIALDASSRDPSLLFRRARAVGRWHPNGPIFVDNRVFNGQAGFQWIMPLQLDDGALILVNRGWVARDANYPRAPQVPTPSGPAEVRGILGPGTARFVELGGQAIAGNVWQNLSVERFRAATGMDALPFVLLESPPPAGAQPVVERPDARAEKHVEYMWTWYALSTLALFLWLILNLERRPGKPNS